MTGDETYPLHMSMVPPLRMFMRQFGIAGSVVPMDPNDTAGTWRVVDGGGHDITGRVVARVVAARIEPPTRGFVIAR